MNNNKALALRKNSLYFTMLCALFLMLSSQFTGAILPLLFILPIIMGSIGIKRGRKSGYLIGMAIIPLAFAISVLWIRYSIGVFSDRINQLAKISAGYNISVNAAGAVTIGFFILSIAMLSISATLFIKLRRNREFYT